MSQYRVRTVLPDNKAQDPGIVMGDLPDDNDLFEFLHNDYGTAFPVGTQVIIERIN